MRKTINHLTTGIIACLCALSTFAPALGERVTLKRHATFTGAAVLVADVAELEGDAATELGAVVVAEPGPQAGSAEVTLQALRTALEGAGANWATLSLGGFAQCRVTRAEPEEPADDGAVPAEPAPDGRTLVSLVSLLVRGEEPGTEAPAAEAAPAARPDALPATPLHEQVVRMLETMNRADREDLLIRLDDRDALNIPAHAGDRFEVTTRTRQGLGRVPLVIRRVRDGRTVQTLRVTAHVALRCRAVVATGTIRRGDVIGASDVTVRQLVLDRMRGVPVASLKAVVGKQAETTLRAGAVLTRDDVAAPVVVRRGDLLHVRVVVGRVTVTTQARARDDAAVGEVIEARAEHTNARLMIEVTGPGQAVSATPGDGTGDEPNNAQRPTRAQE